MEVEVEDEVEVEVEMEMEVEVDVLRRSHKAGTTRKGRSSGSGSSLQVNGSELHLCVVHSI